MPTIFGSVPSNQYPIQDIFKTILLTKLVLSLGRVNYILEFQKIGGGGAYWKFSKTVSAEFYIEKKKICVQKGRGATGLSDYFVPCSC